VTSAPPTERAGPGCGAEPTLAGQYLQAPAVIESGAVRTANRIEIDGRHWAARRFFLWNAVPRRRKRDARRRRCAVQQGRLRDQRLLLMHDALTRVPDTRQRSGSY
jgi:hypothetical protein